MTSAKMITCMIGIAGLVISAAGCVVDDGSADEPNTDTTSSASTVCRQVEHFDYNHAGSTYHWDVTTEFGTGRQFVDERRVGGGFYRQYRVSPYWSLCPVPNEIVRLTSGTVTLIGPHNCLGGFGDLEEYHGSDYQRLLVPRVPFITYNCDP
jgi:hypothetical protein